MAIIFESYSLLLGTQAMLAKLKNDSKSWIICLKILFWDTLI